MLRNYFVTALRTFRNNRFYAFVNILGLSIGLTCCLVVYSIMKHELTFDNWHQNSERIYRVVKHYKADWGMDYDGVVPNAMPAMMMSEAAPYFESVIAMHGPESGTFEFNFNQKHVAFQEDDNILYANRTFLEQMDFPIMAGAGPEALEQPFSVFLTEKIAKKFFGSENPIGQTMTFDEFHNVTVVGILQDTPTNTNAPFDILMSYSTIQKTTNGYLDSWYNTWSAGVYVKLNAGDDVGDKEAMINELVTPHIDESDHDRLSFHLQPLDDIHTNTLYGDGNNYVAPTEILVGFVLLASITLIASILNFVNLATAQAVKRSKEIGIRKTLGSSRQQLVFQFLLETLAIVTVSMLLAFTFGQFFIDMMNSFLSRVAFEIGYDITSVVFALVLAVFVSVLAGIYPATVLSGYNPIGALHNQITISKGTGKVSLRKGLVIGQFVIANLLIITTFIVAAQMKYIKTKDLGFDGDQVMTLILPNKSKDQLNVMEARLAELSFVQKTTVQFSPPQATDNNWNSSYEVVGQEKHDRLNTNLKFADSRYLDFYEIPLVAGRLYTDMDRADSTQQLIVSREFLKRVQLEPEEAIGQTCAFMGSWKGTIVGVTEDFHNWSLNTKLGPVMILNNKGQMNQIAMKVQGANYQQYLPEIEKVFRELVPEGYLEVSILQDRIQESYIVENLVYGAFQIFAGMAILIALMGLYGLVSFIANQKRKSISVRKVFGASHLVILRMFGTEYFVLMLISFVLAAPLSYLLSQEWLNGFHYQIEITATYFIVSFLAVMVITIATVLTKSYQAATANPINALRHE
jgi:putative ABC transport system permease protein